MQENAECPRGWYKNLNKAPAAWSTHTKMISNWGVPFYAERRNTHSAQWADTHAVINPSLSWLLSNYSFLCCKRGAIPINIGLGGIGLTSLSPGPLSLSGTFAGSLAIFQNGWGGICYGAFQSSPLCVIGWRSPQGVLMINVYEIASVNRANNTGIFAVSNNVKIIDFVPTSTAPGQGFTYVLCAGCFSWGGQNIFDLNTELAWFNIAISPNKPVDNPNDPNTTISFTFSQVYHLFAANVTTLKTAVATADCPEMLCSGTTQVADAAWEHQTQIKPDLKLHLRAPRESVDSALLASSGSGFGLSEVEERKGIVYLCGSIKNSRKAVVSGTAAVSPCAPLRFLSEKRWFESVRSFLPFFEFFIAQPIASARRRTAREF
ncbi:hypothetical protein B0H19DRAFT_1075555 [Mycena capillaripes]|nr:hypothetical protein B0H19DRAFT_1075555 [Mycena capillaripes]